ncbi:MAG: hypothetical protein WC977_13215 [Anaerovoracaceae bacterium]|jgi:hypothetical protein
MTTIRQLPTWDEDTLFPDDYSRLDLIADEPGPLKDEEREGIVEAIRHAASDGGGRFHAGTVRPYLPEKVDPHRVGAIVSALAKTGAFIKTGEYALSGNERHRNAQRPVPWYRVIDWEGLR